MFRFCPLISSYTKFERSLSGSLWGGLLMLVQNTEEQFQQVIVELIKGLRFFAYMLKVNFFAIFKLHLLLPYRT